MRLDLPTGPSPNYAQYAAMAAGYLMQDGQADGVLIAVFAEHDWCEQNPPAELALYELLREEFQSYGIRVHDAWYVGPDHWRSFECEDTACCPWPGTPNTSIQSSALNAELVFQGSVVAGTPRQRVKEMCAIVDVGQAKKVTRAVRQECLGLGGGGVAANQLPLILEAWERALTHWPSEPSEETMAFLAGTLQLSTVRDAVMVAVAVSPELSLAGIEGLGFMAPDCAQPSQPPGWPLLGEGYQLDGQQRSSGVLMVAAKSFGEVLMGGGDGSEEVLCGPNWPRLDAAEGLLLHILANLEGASRAPLLCILGWILWCRGRGSWAGVYFELAQDCSQGYPLAKLLDELLCTGYIAMWARDPLTAWPGHSAQGEGDL